MNWAWEIDKLKKVVAGVVVLGLPLLLVAGVTSVVAGPTTLRVVTNFFISVALVLGIQAFTGNSGIVTFGHVAFMGIGAYATAIVTIDPIIKSELMPSLPGFLASSHLGYLPAVGVAGLTAAVIAGVLALPLARMAEGAMAMATFAVLVIFYDVFNNWTGLTRGATGLYGLPTSTGLFSAFGFAVLAIAAGRWFRESNLGLKLRASKTDALAAEALGSNVIRLRWVAWVVSGAVMGLGGGVWAEYNLAFGPKDFFFDQTFALLAMAVVGGMASVSGAVVGAAVITGVTEGLRRAQNTWQLVGLIQIGVAVIILVILYWRSEGLLGRYELDELVSERFRSLRWIGVRRGPAHTTPDGVLPDVKSRRR